MNPWAFSAVYLFPAVFLIGLYFGGPGCLSVVAFTFVFTPVADVFLGRETRPAPRPGRFNLYDFWLWAWIPIHLAVMVTGILWAAGGGRSTFEVVAASLSLGLVSAGGGINIAHEFMHRNRRWPGLASELLMSLVAYPHFCIEHVHGHHARVATPEDPACADFGVPLYAYLPRTLFGSLVSAWRIEARRKAEGRGDRRPRLALWTIAAFAGAWALGGPVGLAVMGLQSALAILVLETINYVEHYGLRRRELEPGKYERVRPRHSWNSPHRLTSAYLFNLPRHSDHHAYAARPYWQLRHYQDVPQLPAGYPTMILVALLPPLWHAIMDPRVRRWQLEDLPADREDAAPPPTTTTMQSA